MKILSDMFDEQQLNLIQKIIDEAVLQRTRQRFGQSDIFPQTIKDRHIDWNDINNTIRGEQRILKTADQSIISHNTYQNDTELIFPIKANEVWFAGLQVYYASNAIAQIKFKWNCSLGVTMKWNFDDSIPNTVTTETGEWFLGADGITDPDIGMANCLVFGGQFGGTATLQWAQDVSTAENTTVLTGSNIVAFRLK